METVRMPFFWIAYVTRLVIYGAWGGFMYWVWSEMIILDGIVKHKDLELETNYTVATNDITLYADTFSFFSLIIVMGFAFIGDGIVLLICRLCIKDDKCRFCCNKKKDGTEKKCFGLTGITVAFLGTATVITIIMLITLPITGTVDENTLLNDDSFFFELTRDVYLNGWESVGNINDYNYYYVESLLDCSGKSIVRHDGNYTAQSCQVFDDPGDYVHDDIFTICCASWIEEDPELDILDKQHELLVWTVWSGLYTLASLAGIGALFGTALCCNVTVPKIAFSEKKQIEDIKVNDAKAKIEIDGDVKEKYTV